LSLENVITDKKDWRKAIRRQNQERKKKVKNDRKQESLEKVAELIEVLR